MLNKKQPFSFQSSLTVEASLIFPLFFFLILFFLYYFQIMQIQENIQYAMRKAGQYCADYGFAIENLKTKSEKSNLLSSLKLNDFLLNVTDALLFQQLAKKHLDSDLLRRSCIIKKENGLFFQGSLNTKDNWIDMTCTYMLQLPLPVFHLFPISVVQRIQVHNFVGQKLSSVSKDSSLSGTKDSKELVFVTQDSSVYHISTDCTYLSLSIEEVKLEELPSLRNKYGGKYYPCERCIENNSSSIHAALYITQTGAHYHLTLNCSGLKRSFQSIPILEAENLSPCSRCAKK